MSLNETDRTFLIEAAKAGIPEAARALAEEANRLKLQSDWKSQYHFSKQLWRFRFEMIRMLCSKSVDFSNADLKVLIAILDGVFDVGIENGTCGAYEFFDYEKICAAAHVSFGQARRTVEALIEIGIISEDVRPRGDRRAMHGLFVPYWGAGPDDDDEPKEAG